MTAATIEFPAHTPTGGLRRSLQILEQLDNARRTSSQVILTGTAVHDLFIDEQGRALYLADLIRSYCERRQLGLVTYRMETGPRSLPTLANGESLGIGNQDDDTHPVDVEVGLNTPVQRAARPSEDEHPTTTLRRVIRELRATGTPSVMLVDYADLVLHPESAHNLASGLLVEMIQALTADTLGWQRPGLQMILIDRGGRLLDRLNGQAGFQTVEVGPPDVTEVSIYLGRKVDEAAKSRLFLSHDLTVERASRLSGGLLNRNLGEAAATSSPENPVTARGLSLLKGRAISHQSGGTLDLMTDEVSFDQDVAGMHPVRLYLRDLDNLGTRTVRIVLAGPPGTGKTYSATAIAGTLGVPLVSFGQILGELLGQAENNMRRALAILRAMAPVCLFIDEADQKALGSREAGHRTSNEAHLALRAALFDFLGDTGEDSGISVVATTNVPDYLDERARSRFEFLPVLFASGVELAQMISIHARRSRVCLDGDLTDLMTAYVDGGSVMSGRSAQRLLRKAQRLAARKGERTVTPTTIAAALAEWVGNDWTLKAEHSTLASLDALSDLDNLPWIAARHLGHTEPIPAYIRPWVGEDGSLRLAEIQHRLAELRSAGVW